VERISIRRGKLGIAALAAPLHWKTETRERARPRLSFV
jgi:hypothetical protein